VLPRLVEMESEYGSLTRGMLAAHGKMRARAKAAARQNGKGSGLAPGNPAPRAVFTALRGGMQQFVDALTARLDPKSVLLRTPVSAIEKTAEGWTVEAGGTTGSYDAVIVASPAWAAGVLLSQVDAALGEALSEIPYSSSITVNLIYDEAKLSSLPDGFGFLIPASEGRAMLACTFVHLKFLGRTPPGKAVLRAFLGGAKNESLLAETDDTLVAIVRRELSEILGIETEPEHTQVSRWRRAMAQYAVGHQERMQRIAERVAALPGLRLAGNAYDGIGIPDCIRLGRKAARELVAEGKPALQ
jgi:oxygen-dependent protoporphyrinogen oxidase